MAFPLSYACSATLPSTSLVSRELDQMGFIANRSSMNISRTFLSLQTPSENEGSRAVLSLDVTKTFGVGIYLAGSGEIWVWSFFYRMDKNAL